MTQREEDNSYAISCDYVYIWKATKNKIMSYTKNKIMSYYLKYIFFLKQKKWWKRLKIEIGCLKKVIGVFED